VVGSWTVRYHEGMSTALEPLAARSPRN
jgi:hypothetical protein